VHGVPRLSRRARSGVRRSAASHLGSSGRRFAFRLHDRPQLGDNIANIGERAGPELRMQQLTIVGELERVDRLESLSHHIKGIHAAKCEQLVLVHLPHKLGNRTAKGRKELLSEEEQPGGACLGHSHCANGILDLCRRRVWSPFDFQSRESGLQPLGACPELAIDLSAGAELYAQRGVQLLDRGLVIMGHDVERAQVHLLDWLLSQLFQHCWTAENCRQ